MDLLQQRCWVVAHPAPVRDRMEQDLKRLGWDVDSLATPVSAGDTKLHACFAGVVCFPGLSQEDLRHIETLIIATGIPIVGVVSPECLHNDEVRNVIANLCCGFLVEPHELEELDSLLRHAARLGKLQQEVAAGPRNVDVAEASPGEYEMVGSTPAMWNLFKTIRKVAAVDASVCISGESGTGKELTAQAIHERSPRAAQPFHAINCGALPDHLVQSELFGHEKGAFTGAVQRKIGRIEVADGGTLFLDEIGDLPFELQVNLLRFLETRCVQRVGGLEEIPVDVRILAATHVDLEKAVAEQRFREDLYHRLNVLQVKVPPLREHPEDIEILARYFFKRFSHEKPDQLKGFSSEALLVMRLYRWPGNVRELINRVRRAMVMCDNRLIRPDDLGIERRNLPRCSMTLEQARDIAERDILLSALGRNHNQVQPASKELGVSRVTIYRLLEKHGIPRDLS